MNINLRPSQILSQVESYSIFAVESLEKLKPGWDLTLKKLFWDTGD